MLVYFPYVCSSFARIPLAKACHMAELRSKRQERTGGFLMGTATKSCAKGIVTGKNRKLGH
jgi:hypothetical protein